ncbi:MAG: hypothetical protein LR008_00045 [Candidatus Pacebacteria bacterium]|nr:hypothetical protein [Candidatus Paceibacterota bacterium]
MFFTFWIQTLSYSLIATVTALAMLGVSQAQVRTSSNYQLQSDSINVGGGLSSSTAYVQESTVGEIATGPSDSSTYSLRAGYQQMQEVFVSLSTTGNVVMSPDLPGLTGGASNGSTTATVITDSPSGYSLTIKAEDSPAMQSGVGTIADYSPSGSVPDFSFTTIATDAHFGFSPEGVDIVQAWLDDNGGVCNIGSADTALACWDGLSTADIVVSEGVGANYPVGATTTINFRVGVGGAAGVTAGVYIATTTVTALPL